MLLSVYRTLTRHAGGPLKGLLKRRLAKGKEDATRWPEKTGVPGRPRPPGPLVWLHAASVGEAQSALVLIEKICTNYPHLHILVTSGTLTSAEMLEKRLPENAFHQFAPMDHPEWVKKFLDYWQPGLALWLESELWPNILAALKERNIPAILLNARLSPKSFKNWKRFSKSAEEVLSAFSLILCQTHEDAVSYRLLNAPNVSISGNLKYNAAPLPYDEANFQKLQKTLQGRPVWLYASTHACEEDLAARLHKRLKKEIPDLLTIIAPRHPERGTELEQSLQKHHLRICRRTSNHHLPEQNTDLYLADTLGELGLFYRLSPIAVIGRSFSDDGGGGHNPIEAAQLDCAVLHGPHVQNLQKIYDDMAEMEASIALNNEEHFYNSLKLLLTDALYLQNVQEKSRRFCEKQANTLEDVWKLLTPYIQELRQEAA